MEWDGMGRLYIDGLFGEEGRWYEGLRRKAVYVKKLADSLDFIDAVYRRRIEW